VKFRFTKKLGSQLVLLGLAIVIIILYGRELGENAAARDLLLSYGYLGVFVISIISGFNVIVPIPAAFLIPTLSDAGLNYYLLLVIITLGMTLGDGIGYLIGSAGRNSLNHNENLNFTTRLIKIRDRHPRWPLVILALYVAFAPAPNELLVIPMAFIGYKLKRMLIVVFFGNMIFNLYGSYLFNLLLDLL